jgi:orotidine-5'-phosphate decarboxylase
MLDLKEKLIVALDVDTFEIAQKFVGLLLPKVKFFKVGSQLFTASGPKAIKMIGEKGGRVFLDLKFHDIPNTVYNAAASATSKDAVFMMTLHTLGGAEMLKAAVKGASDKAAELKIKKPYLIGVTVLTSETADKDTSRRVLERARLAKDSGLDGVVCAVSEASMIRKEFGKEFIIVTPGIRPEKSGPDGQKRRATAADALKAGSDFLVVGRPILEAKDPLKMIENIAIAAGTAPGGDSPC